MNYMNRILFEGPGWYLGNLGESCTNLCSAKGLACDATTMSDVDNDTKLVKTALDVGVACQVLADDTGSITPFFLPNYNGKTQCEDLRNGATSSCEQVYNGSLNLQRFCFCT